MKHLVSIIMNCRNGQEYLRESINSVINQTYNNWELIFVDNASTDKSKDIFYLYKDDRMKYLHLEKPLNLGSARQIALENCNGEYISFLDTDDIWFKKKIEKQITYFEDTDVGMVISNTIFFSKTKKKTFYNKKPPTGYVFKDLLKRYFISLETLMCKKKFIEDISFKFDKEYSLISDMDLTLRLSLISKLAYCPMELAQWRVHSLSDSWKKKDLFFLEQLNLIEKLGLLKENVNNDIFIKEKKKFKKKINFSIILNMLENGAKKKEIINNIIKKKLSISKFLIVLSLLAFPYSRSLVKLYRSYFSILPQ